MKRIGETNKLSLEEAGEGLTEKAISKSCMTCGHFKVCAIYGLYKSGIESQFPEVIKAEDLAWICRSYKEEIIPAATGDNTKLTDKVLRRL